MQKTYSKYLLVSIIISLSSCVSARQLQEQEYLLARQHIKGNRKISKKALANYYQQHPNHTLLGIPFRLWLYQLGKRNFHEEAIRQRIRAREAEYDARLAAAAGNERSIKRLKGRWKRKLARYTALLKEGNLLMRWGEAPVLYDPQKRTATEQSLQAYLHAKGYFDAQVHSTIKLRKKRATVTYQIVENQPHLIGKVRLKTPDEAIAQLLQDHQQQSLLRLGDCYDQEVLYQERERIHDLLNDQGYFDFNKQYIRFNVDTTAVDNTVVVETFVGVPTNRATHPVFHIENIIFEVDTEENANTQTQPTITYRDITFKNPEEHFRPKALAYKIPLAPTQLYRRKDMLEVQQRLSRLSIFKYVNITQKVTKKGDLIPHIHVGLLDRYQISNELGLQVSRWVPRPFYKLSLSGRNLLRQLEITSLAAHVGAEGVATLTEEHTLVSSKAWGIELSLSFPQFLLPLRESTHAALDSLSPVTQILGGYDFTHRPEYIQHTVKTFAKYAWKDSGRGKYALIPLQVDLINTTNVSTAFRKRLDKFKKEGNNLYRTFNPSWVSHMSFRTTFCDPPEDANKILPYSFSQLYFESGGLFQNFFDLRRITPRLEYYQYVKLNLTHSQHIPLFFDSTLFAYHLNLGIAIPYGEYKVLPYDRHYFAGGANGIRAWLPRSLGPGTYKAPKRSDNNPPLEQPGELLLQGSVEVRQPIIGFLEGALFVDAGNVWMLRATKRLGGQFHWKDFYKAIAVGAGFGIRLNFNFLVLRLDAGIKLYDPARPAGDRFIGNKIAFNKWLGLPGQTVYSIGVGYPF